MYKDLYVFPCVFIYEEDGISIYFPDLDGCVSHGEDDETALLSAKEALTLHLYGIEQDNEEIPEPTKLKELDIDDGERAILIETFMPVFRAKQLNKYVKKTLTIPQWLNIEAERSGVNFSQILQNGLKEYLHMDANS